ncbi:MAG: hypothetical protein HUJ93_08325, partial [Bacteroidales bacterium]|nr:hypothetical protein [Bacteroidales bacterium]
MKKSESAPDQLKIVTPQEEQELIELGRGEHVEYDASQTWVDLFTANAEKNPEKTAVADKDTQLTYSELDRKSDALA